MASLSIQIPKCGDGQCISVLRKAVEEFNDCGFQKVVIQPVGSSNWIDVESAKDGLPVDEYASLQSRYFRLLRIMNTNDQMVVNVTRQIQGDTAAPKSSEPDFITIDLDKIAKESRRIAFSEFINREFVVVTGSLAGPFESGASVEFFQAHRETLSHLQGLAANLTLELHSRSREIEAERQRMLASAREEIANERALAVKDLAAKESVLKEKETKFEVEVAKLRRESNMVARRAAETALKTAVQKTTNRFEFTAATKSRMGFVAAAYIVLLLSLGSVAASLFVRELSSPTIDTSNLNATNWVGPIRASVALVGFVLALSFFLRWLNYFAKRSADADFHSKQFELDIDRARWLAELVMEAKREGQAALPDELVVRLSKGLFSERDSSTKFESMTATDALASAMISSAAKAKVAIGGAELELTKPGIRRMSRTQFDVAEE